MDILYLSQYFPPEISAPAARVHEFSREWVRLGHRVQVVTAFPNHPTGVVPPAYRGRLWDREVVDGIEVFRNWTLAVPNRALPLRVASQISFPLSITLLGLPRVRRPDVVLATSPSSFTSVSGLTFARVLRAPFVFEVRDLWPQLFIEMGMIKNRALISVLEAAELLQYRRAQRIVVVTERFKEVLAGRGVPPDKVDVVPNGVALEVFREDGAKRAALRQQLGLGDRFVLGYVGTHGLLQGLGSVLDAADILRGDDRIRFLFVGHGHEREKLLKLAADRALPNVVFVPGRPREEIPGYYSVCDACLIALRKEPFLAQNFVPSKLFEIMACGRAVVASLAGEGAAMVREAGAGVVVPPEDGAALARAVTDLAEHPERTRTYGRAGRERVQARYARRALAERYAGILAKVAT